MARCLAFIAAESPDLAVVIEAWANLPEPLKAGIVAMVGVSRD